MAEPRAFPRYRSIGARATLVLSCRGAGAQGDAGRDRLEMDSRETADRAVRLGIYRFFVDRGRPPVPAELCETIGMGQAAIEDTLRRLHENHVVVLAPGTPYIWMANPFSALPTPFVVDADDREWFGNCIWDALGIVAMLGGTGSVRTWCPDCREPLQVSVEDNQLTDGEGVVHFAVPAANWWDDIGFN
jgi:hypothetical protein